MKNKIINTVIVFGFYIYGVVLGLLNHIIPDWSIVLLSSIVGGSIWIFVLFRTKD